MFKKNEELLEGKKSPRGNRRGRQRNKKVEHETRREDESLGSKNSCRRDAAENDERWYAASQQLLNDAFSMSTPYSVGSPLTFSPIVCDPTGPLTDSMRRSTKYVAPGICMLHVIPCPGICKTPTDPVNIAAGKIAQWLRHANAGATNYAPQNLLFYLLAMDNAYMLWNWLTRAYTFMMTYNQTNQYLPRALINAMGLDFDSLSANMNDFRGLINKLGSQLASYAVPATMPYFTRHAFMFSNVYTDNQDFKSQLYVFNPTLLYRWAEDPEDGYNVGTLQPIMIKGQRRDFGAVDALIKDIMGSIHGSTDFRTMSGDILKAYGFSNLLTVPEVHEGDMLLPYYEERVLSQIENAMSTGAPHPDHLSDLAIIEDYAQNCAVFDPKFNLAGCDGIVPVEEVPLNFHKQDVTPGDVAEATRLMWISSMANVIYGEQGTGSNNFRTGYYSLGSCGTEIVTEITITRLKSDGSGGTTTTTLPSRTRLDDLSWSGSANGIWAFSRRPMTLTYTVDPADSQYSNVSFHLSDIIGEIDNLTVVNGNNIQKMNEVALYSLFDVPSIGANS